MHNKYHRYIYIYMCTSYRKLAYNNHHSQITHFLSYPQSHPTAPGRRHDRRTKVYWVPNHQQLRSKSSEETRKPGDSCGDSWRFHWLNLKRYLPGIELCWVVWYTKVRSPQSRSWDSVVPLFLWDAFVKPAGVLLLFFFGVGENPNLKAFILTRKYWKGL